MIGIGDNGALLQSVAYAIHVFVDRDGVSMIYFDTDDASMKGYNIFLFLFSNRHDRLIFSKQNEDDVGRNGFIEMQVQSLSSHLRSAGDDILSGCKIWISDYRSPIVHASPDVARLIHKTAGSEFL
jgi:hypothetical protein